MPESKDFILRNSGIININELYKDDSKIEQNNVNNNINFYGTVVNHIYGTPQIS